MEGKMALIECEECGQLISDKARACPNCGNPVKRFKKNRMIPIKAKHKYKIFLLLSIIVALIICLISVFIANKNRKTILEKIVCSDYKVLKEEMGNNIRITDALFFKRTSKSSKDKVWYQVLIVYKQNNSTKYAGFDDEGRYLGDGNKYVGSTNNLGDARDNLIVTTMKVEYEQYTKGMDQVMYTTDEYEPVVEEKEMEKYDQCVVPVSIEKIK